MIYSIPRVVQSVQIYACGYAYEIQSVFAAEFTCVQDGAAEVFQRTVLSLYKIGMYRHALTSHLGKSVLQSPNILLPRSHE